MSALQIFKFMCEGNIKVKFRKKKLYENMGWIYLAQDGWS